MAIQTYLLIAGVLVAVAGFKYTEDSLREVSVSKGIEIEDEAMQEVAAAIECPAEVSSDNDAGIIKSIRRIKVLNRSIVVLLLMIAVSSILLDIFARLPK